MYHNSGDLSDREGYDFDQLKAIAMVEVRFDLQLPLNHSPMHP